MPTPRSEHEARFCTSLAEGIALGVDSYGQLGDLLGEVITDGVSDEALEALEVLAIGIGVPLIAHVRAFEMTEGLWESYPPPLDAIRAARLLGESYAVCLLVPLGEDASDAPVAPMEEINALLTPPLVAWLERWVDEVPRGA